MNGGDEIHSVVSSTENCPWSGSQIPDRLGKWTKFNVYGSSGRCCGVHDPAGEIPDTLNSRARPLEDRQDRGSGTAAPGRSKSITTDKEMRGGVDGKRKDRHCTLPSSRMTAVCVP